jgi:hypothetical protein
MFAHPGRFFVGTGPLEINDKNRGAGRFIAIEAA